MESSRESIRKYISKNFLSVKSKALKDGENLLAGGIIDSLGILDVVAFLEQHFGIVVDDDELISENFQSIDALTQFAERKLSQMLSRENN